MLGPGSTESEMSIDFARTEINELRNKLEKSK
jgi:hypothetical protein